MPTFRRGASVSQGRDVTSNENIRPPRRRGGCFQSRCSPVVNLSIQNNVEPVAGSSGTQKQATNKTNEKKPVPSQMAADEMGQLDQDSKPKWTRRGDGVYTDSESDDSSEKCHNGNLNKGQLDKDLAAKWTRHGDAVYTDSEPENDKENHDNEELNESKMEFTIGETEEKIKKEIATIREAIETEVRAESRLYILKLKQRIADLEDKVRFFESTQSIPIPNKEKRVMIGSALQVHPDAPGSESDTLRTLPSKSSMPFDKTRPYSKTISSNLFYKFGINAGSIESIITMLIEMNNVQPMGSKLDDIQISAIREILTLKSYDVKPAHISALDILLNWSVNTIYPALCAFWVGLLNENLNAILCSVKSVSGMPPKGTEIILRLNGLLDGNPPNPVRVFYCRALGNAAMHESGRELLMSEILAVSKLTAIQLTVANDSLQISAACTLCNFAQLLLLKTESDRVELGSRQDVLEVIISVIEKLDSFTSFSSAVLICLLQAIGTLMWGSAAVIGVAKNRGILSIVNKIKDCVTDDAAKDACRDITEMVLAI